MSCPLDYRAISTKTRRANVIFLMLYPMTDPEPPLAAGGCWIPSASPALSMENPSSRRENLNFNFKNVTHRRRGQRKEWGCSDW